MSLTIAPVTNNHRAGRDRLTSFMSHSLPAALERAHDRTMFDIRGVTRLTGTRQRDGRLERMLLKQRRAHERCAATPTRCCHACL
jgi:hypothetical protein